MYPLPLSSPHLCQLVVLTPVNLNWCTAVKSHFVHIITDCELIVLHAQVIKITDFDHKLYHSPRTSCVLTNSQYSTSNILKAKFTLHCTIITGTISCPSYLSFSLLSLPSPTSPFWLNHLSIIIIEPKNRSAMHWNVITCITITTSHNLEILSILKDWTLSNT